MLGRQRVKALIQSIICSFVCQFTHRFFIHPLLTFIHFVLTRTLVYFYSYCLFISLFVCLFPLAIVISKDDRIKITWRTEKQTRSNGKPLTPNDKKTKPPQKLEIEKKVATEDPFHPLSPLKENNTVREKRGREQ